jgi:hypothetical protein
MTQNGFYVLLNIRTPGGYESFGKFNLGNKRKAALQIFKQLRGSPAVDEQTLLTIELMETVNELPLTYIFRLYA